MVDRPSCPCIVARRLDGFDGKDPSRHRSDGRTAAEALLTAEHTQTSERPHRGGGRRFDRSQARRGRANSLALPSVPRPSGTDLRNECRKPDTCGAGFGEKIERALNRQAKEMTFRVISPHRGWIPSTPQATTTGHPPGLPSEGPATCDLRPETCDLFFPDLRPIVEVSASPTPSRAGPIRERNFV